MSGTRPYRPPEGTPPYCIVLPKQLQRMYEPRDRWAAQYIPAILTMVYLIVIVVVLRSWLRAKDLLILAALASGWLGVQFLCLRSRWRRRIQDHLVPQVARARGFAYPGRIVQAVDGSLMLVVQMTIQQYFRVSDARVALNGLEVGTCVVFLPNCTYELRYDQIRRWNSVTQVGWNEALVYQSGDRDRSAFVRTRPINPPAVAEQKLRVGVAP